MIIPTLPERARFDARHHGSPVFYRIVRAGPGIGGCTNCAGVRFVHLSFAKAGPFAHPPDSREPLLYSAPDGSPDGTPAGWYIVETRGYPCPVCNPTNGRAAHAA